MNILDGIRVLDISQFLSGPRASQLLAMFGAEVIKIEPPTGDTMRLLLSMSGSERAMSALHHDKKGMVIDLKQPDGKAVFLRLAKLSDVIVDNLKPGVLDDMGLSAAALREANPQLIYARISGFGNTGPLAGRTAFDIIAQATGGIMYANGQEDRPPGTMFADLVSGVYCVLGVLLALIDRQKTGKGREIDISMQDVMYFNNFWGFIEKANGPALADLTRIFGREIKRLLTDRDHPMPFWNSYRAKDGHVAVVALTDAQWRALIDIIGTEDLANDERFSNFVERVRNSDLACGTVAAWMAERSCAEIIDALTARRIPCGKVQNYDQINNDPQLAARGMYEKVEHPRLGPIDIPGNPIQFVGAEKNPSFPAPDMGEHTHRIAKNIIGLTDEEIRRLEARGTLR